MKYSKDIRQAFGFEVFPVKNGYRVLQLQDNYIYDKLYYSKREAENWVDFLIDFFKNHS